MQKKNYRDRYYSSKIRSLVFFTIMYELLVLLVLLACNMYNSVIDLGEFGADLLVFGSMGALLLVMLHQTAVLLSVFPLTQSLLNCVVSSCVILMLPATPISATLRS